MQWQAGRNNWRNFVQTSNISTYIYSKLEVCPSLKGKKLFPIIEDFPLFYARVISFPFESNDINCTRVSLGDKANIGVEQSTC